MDEIFEHFEKPSCTSNFTTMPRRKKPKNLVCIEPIPETTKHDSQIIDFESTRKAFRNFRQCVLPFAHKKERLGGYICKKQVSQWFRFIFRCYC